MFSSNFGLIHTVCAMIAIVTGGLVVFLRKETRRHRIVGYLFFGAMVMMNLAVLLTSSIYSFGPFHWMAIGSLALVTSGISAPLFFRNSGNWLRTHYNLMLWSLQD